MFALSISVYFFMLQKGWEITGIVKRLTWLTCSGIHVFLHVPNRFEVSVVSVTFTFSEISMFFYICSKQGWELQVL